MATTLNAITFPDDTLWLDKWDHSSINQTVSVTLGGKQVIEESQKQKGRSITLAGEWLDKTVLDALVVERDTLDNTMVLTLNDGRTFNVRFKQAPDALNVIPIIEYAGYLAGDYFDVTLKLFEI